MRGKPGRKPTAQKPVVETAAKPAETIETMENAEETPKAERKPYGQRPSRTPIANRTNLAMENRDPNYEYYVASVKKGRIPILQASGWEVVTDGTEIGSKMVEGNKLPGSASTRPIGNGDVGVLMRKPRDWHDEDMKPVYAKAKRVEDSIYGKNRDDGLENHGTTARTSLGTFSK